MTLRRASAARCRSGWTRTWSGRPARRPGPARPSRQMPRSGSASRSRRSPRGRPRQATGMVASLLRLAGHRPVPNLSTLRRKRKTLAVRPRIAVSMDRPARSSPFGTSLRDALPGARQHRHRAARRRRAAVSQAWRVGPPTVARGPSGHQREHARSSGGRAHPQERRRRSDPHAAQDPAGQWTVPMRPAVAAPPSSNGGPRRAFRSGGTGAPGRKTARRRRLAARRRAPRSATGGRSGRAGPDATPEVASGRRCDASGQSASASPRETPDRQAAEVHVRVALMNRLPPPGTAEIVRAA